MLCTKASGHVHFHKLRSARVARPETYRDWDWPAQYVTTCKEEVHYPGGLAALVNTKTGQRRMRSLLLLGHGKI